MQSKNFRLAKIILTNIGLTAAVASVVVFPGIALMYDWLYKQTRQPSWKNKKSLQGLCKRGMVKIQKNSQGVSIILTSKGKKRLSQYQLQDLKITNVLPWDGKWRMVMFDVPESNRTARDEIRRHLHRLGFEVIQKSVFIHPYPCNHIVEILRSYYHLAPGQLYIFEAKILEGEKILKNRFRLN